MKSLLVAAGLLVGASAWATTETYEFSAHTGNFTYPSGHITFTGTSTWGYMVTDEWLDGRFAFEDGTSSGTHRNYWTVRQFKTNDVYVTGLNNTNSTARMFAIYNLGKGDVITITMPDASNDKITASTTNIKKEDTGVAVAADEQIVSGQRYVVTTDEATTSVVFKGAQYCCVTKIEIESISATIAELKANETSSDFATYIDGLTFNSVNDVYAAHTAWQASHAVVTDGLRDITKVIRNAAIADATAWGGASTRSGEQYTGAPDDTYLDIYNGTINSNQTIYGVPAGVYVIKAATRASSGTPGTLYVNDGTSDIGKVGQITNVGNTGGDLGNGWSYQEMVVTLTSTKNLLIGFWADASSIKWAGCDDWHMYKVESVSKTITAGWATYCSPYALDFSSSIDNLEAAYIVTGGNGSTLTTTQITGAIPANTGILLKGSGECVIPVVASGDAANVSGNKLVGVTSAAHFDQNTIYVLMATPSEGFYKNANAEGFTVGANTAYLPADFAGAAAPAFYSLFDSETTGVGATLVNSERVNNEVFYLQGQRVGQPTKGLYIVGGRKVIVK